MLFLYFHSNWVTTHVIPQGTQGVLGQHNTDNYIAWRSWMMPDLIGGFNVNEKYDRLWQSSSRMVENKNIWTCQCDMSIWYHYDDVWMPLTSQWSYENELNTQFECSHGLVWGVCVCVPDSEISKKCPSMSILEGLCMWKKKIVINDNSPSYTVHEINTSVVWVVTVITTQILGMQIDAKNGPRIMVVAVRTQILQDEGATSRDKARKTKEELLSYSKFAGLAMAQTMVKPSLKTPVFKKKSSKMEERMQNEMQIDVHPHKKSHQTWSISISRLLFQALTQNRNLLLLPWSSTWKRKITMSIIAY